MRNFIIILLILSCVGFYFHYKKNKKVPILGGRSNLIVADGKYRYEPINEKAFNFIKKMGNGKYYEEREKYPRIVIYHNVVDTSCPYRKSIQTQMKNYSQSADWNNAYRFVNYDVKQSEALYFNTIEEFNETKEFINVCDYFCIIDFERNAIYSSGMKNDEAFVYDVLNSFYE